MRISEDITPFDIDSRIIDKRNGHVYLLMAFRIPQEHPVVTKLYKSVVKSAEKEKEERLNKPGSMSRQMAAFTLMYKDAYATKEDVPLAIDYTGYLVTTDVPQRSPKKCFTSEHLGYILEVRRNRLALCKLLKRVLASDDPQAFLDELIADLQFPEPCELYGAPVLGTIDEGEIDWYEAHLPFDLDYPAGRWLFEEARKWT
jgi:hypothetical protein